MSTFTKLYQKIARWQKETFPGATAASAVEHLRREANELHEHYWGDGGSGGQFIRRNPKGTRAERAEEAADCFFMLVQYAEIEGFDLTDAVAAKFEKNKARTWKAPDAHGVVEHADG